MKFSYFTIKYPKTIPTTIVIKTTVPIKNILVNAADLLLPPIGPAGGAFLSFCNEGGPPSIRIIGFPWLTLLVLFEIPSLIGDVSLTLLVPPVLLTKNILSLPSLKISFRSKVNPIKQGPYLSIN